MASTANAVITKFRGFYADCSSSDASDILQDVLKEVESRLQVRGTTTTISLTANTQEYALNADITSIQEVMYKETANASTWTSILPTNIDKLDRTRPGWRADDQTGTPTEYYIFGAASSDTATNKMGFLPIPDTSTSAGYPIVTVWCNQWASLTTSETMPDNLMNDNILVYGMNYYYAIRRDLLDAAKNWLGLYEKEIAKNENHLRNLPGDDDPTIIYSPVHSLTKSV